MIAFDNEGDETRTRLLYQVGAWMSTCDLTGGKGTLDREEIALRQAIHEFRSYKNTGDLARALNLLVEREGEWGIWRKNLDLFLKELKERPPEMSPEYRECMYLIALRVATACREDEGTKSFLQSLLDWIQDRLISPPTLAREEYLNISAIEKDALNKLAETLSLRHRLIE